MLGKYWSLSSGVSRWYFIMYIFLGKFDIMSCPKMLGILVYGVLLWSVEMVVYNILYISKPKRHDSIKTCGAIRWGGLLVVLDE